MKHHPNHCEDRKVTLANSFPINKFTDPTVDLTPLESHPYTISHPIPFRMTSLRKNRRGVPDWHNRPIPDVILPAASLIASLDRQGRHRQGRSRQPFRS